MTDHEHHIRAHALPFQDRALLCDRPRRTPVLVDDHRGHALRNYVWRRLAVGRVVEDGPAAPAAAVVRVRMDVDESRGYIAPGCIDHPFGAGPGQVTQSDDPPPSHTDVGAEPRIAGSVEDPSAADEQVEVFDLLGGER